ELEQGHLTITERQTIAIIVCRLCEAAETEAVQVRQEGIYADEVNGAHGWYVGRIPQGLPDPQGTVVLAAVVTIRMQPNANRLLQRTILDQRGGGPAAL